MPQPGLKILFVGILPPHQGGSAFVSASLLAACADLGHSVQAISPITEKTLSGGDSFAAEHPHIRVTRYVVPYWVIWPTQAEAHEYRTLETEQIRRQFPALVSRWRPDLVVIGHERFAWQVPDLARTAGLPCVLLFHSGATKALLGTPMGRELMAQFHKVDLLITVAEHLASDLRQLGLERVTTVPNGVDLARFSPMPRDSVLQAQLVIGDDDLVVMHVSNLKPIKRPPDLVHSASQAVARDSRLKYVIVGDGPMGPQMSETCGRAGLGGNFRFVGWVDHRRLPDYLNLADVVVMPSDAEGQALVYLETQACGRVLLASDIPAAREVIRDGDTGLLFRKGDVGDLAVQTLRAAADPELRRSIGRRARERVQSHSQWKSAAAYLRSFEAVLGQSRRS